MNAMPKIALAALAAVALSPFAAHAEKVNLTFLTHWSPESVAMLEKAASAYAKEHADVAVAIRAVPFGDLLTTLRASGGGRGGPTMASIYNAWLPDLAKDKLIAQIPEAMGTEVKADWPAGVVGASSTGGALYGFPNEIDLYALNYNKKLFEAAGIAAPPANWDELIADAKKLSDKSKGQQGFGMINSWTAGVIHPFASLLASNGGQLIADGKPQLDSAAAKETFALYEKLVKEGLTDPAMGTSDANTTGPFLDNFVSGKNGHDHHGELVGERAQIGHGRQVRGHRHSCHSRRAPRRQAAFHLLFVDDGGERQGEPGRAEGGVGIPLLAERPEIGAERRLGHGRDPGVDGNPAVADVRRGGFRGKTQRPVPQGLYRRGAECGSVPGGPRRAGILGVAAAACRGGAVRQGERGGRRGRGAGRRDLDSRQGGEIERAPVVEPTRRDQGCDRDEERDGHERVAGA